MEPSDLAALTSRWGESQKRQDWRFGIFAALLAEINRDRKQRSEPFEPADFFPSLKPPEEPEDEGEQQLAFMEMMGAPEEKLEAMRGYIRKKKSDG